MSETTGAIDALSPEEIALRDSMRGDETADLPDAPAAAAEPEPAETDLDDVVDTEPAADGRTRMVPHQQFHAANERRKAAEAKAAAAETKLATETARVNERLNILMQATQQAVASAQAPAAAPAVEIPDVTVDPVGHFKALHEQTAQALAETRAIVQGFQERSQQAQAVSELRSWAVAQETAFMSQEPAYQAAMDHLKAGRHKELEAPGVADPVERERIIFGDTTAIAMRARQ